jgi:TatD DNase family protein
MKAKGNVLYNYVDSHFHSFHMMKKGTDIHELYHRLGESSFAGGIDIGVDPDDVKERYELLHGFPDIYLSAGLYPGYAGENNQSSLLKQLERNVESFPVVALGEIGVDCHHDFAPPEEQQAFFADCIRVANDADLPIIVHNRDADSYVYETLKTHPPKRGGIIHCFSSQREWAVRFVEAGLYISFAGNITYKNAEPLRDAALAVPKDRLLVETDSPYLSPHPHRGKPNNPGRILHTYQFLADLLSMEPQELVDQVRENLFRIIRKSLETEKTR